MMTTDALAINSSGAELQNHDDVEATQALGFWVYLMSDLILFSALFATYVVMDHNYAGGPTGKELFHLSDTLIETMLLLCSSAVFGLAMVAMHQGKNSMLLAGLAGTFLLGLAFIVMEAIEFTSMIHNGAGPQRSGFLSAFFTLVGTHGAHVTFGLIWLAVMMGQMAAKGLTRPVQARLMRLGMFWHFLDIIWIGLFTVVYLMGVM